MVHNFNAGPSILPKEVFQQASEGILNFNNSGLSILEIGHRTPLFEAVLEEARQHARNLMNLDDDHEVLFLHGGATTQFFMVPMNFLGENDTAAYLDGGLWGTKPIKEAGRFGKVNVVASSRDKNYSYLPKSYTIPADAAYFHYTTNNTIEGTQMHHVPQTNVPLIADMSSDILSCSMNFNQFDLIYAGAQKNIGAAGVCMVVVKKSFLQQAKRSLPPMLDYSKHVENGSMLNTPPVFAIYVCMLTLRWLAQQGGIPAIEKINDVKASLLYKTLDAFPVFTPTVAKEDRSKMNVVFVMDDKTLEAEFLALCKKEGMSGVKGHRSVGGFRISLYNALPLSSVEVITDLMKHFAQTKG